MRTVTRPDGSTYIVTSRTIYGALGWIPIEHEDSVLAMLDEYFKALASDSTVEGAALKLPEKSRINAMKAGELIRKFDQVTGYLNGPVAEKGFKVPGWPNCIGIFNKGRVYGEEYSDLAGQVADALKAVLDDLGAKDSISVNID